MDFRSSFIQTPSIILRKCVMHIRERIAFVHETGVIENANFGNFFVKIYVVAY